METSGPPAVNRTPSPIVHMSRSSRGCGWANCFRGDMRPAYWLEAVRMVHEKLPGKHTKRLRPSNSTLLLIF